MSKIVAQSSSSGSVHPPEAGRYSAWTDEQQPGVFSKRRLSPTTQALGTFFGVLALNVAWSYSGIFGAPLMWIIGWPLSTFIVYQVAKSKAETVREKELQKLADLPAAVDQFFVHINLFAFTSVYGEDDGVLSLVGGMAHFVGLKTQFTLAKGHNLAGFWRDRYDGEFVVYRARFDTEAFKGDAEIRFRMNSHFEDPFHKSFKAWNDDLERVDFHGIIEPPITVSPVAMQKAYRQALFTEVLTIFYVAESAVLAHLVWGWIGTLVALLVGWTLADLAARPFRQLHAIDKGRYRRVRSTPFRKPMVLLALQRMLSRAGKRSLTQRQSG
jgi:hypothetical protein